MRQKSADAVMAATGRKAEETARDTALTGTFGGGAAGRAPAEPAATATHPGATGTDAVSTSDPNSPITNPPPAPRSGT